MDNYLQGQILAALVERDWPKLLGYSLIFLFIWLQVKGLKKSLDALNKTISGSFVKMEEKFSAGETRFDSIESILLNFEHRITELETIKGHS